MSTGPTADVSVRVAWADDAGAIADVQVRGWRHLYAGLLPADDLPDDVASVAQTWRTAMSRPDDARYRVLVALERNRVVGFAVTTPASDAVEDVAALAESAARANRLRLRRLWLAQDAAFFATVLPLGIGLKRLRSAW